MVVLKLVGVEVDSQALLFVHFYKLCFLWVYMSSCMSLQGRQAQSSTAVLYAARPA